MATEVTIDTNLPMSQLAEVFKKSMRASWFSEIRGGGAEFSNLPRDAFSGLEKDPPTFSVMAIMGGGGADIQKSAVCMAAWERGDRVQLQLTVTKALGALGVKAKGKIRKFANAVGAEDSSAKISGL